jgi:hypothetical protein
MIVVPLGKCGDLDELEERRERSQPVEYENCSFESLRVGSETRKG